MGLRLGSGTDRRLTLIERTLEIRDGAARRDRDVAADAAVREEERLVVVAEAEAEYDRLIPERQAIGREWLEALGTYRTAVRSLALAATAVRSLAERDGRLLEVQAEAREHGAQRPSPSGRLFGPGDALELVAAQLRELEELAR